MHIREGCESLRRREIVDCNRHSASCGGEEGAAKDKSSEQDSERGDHTALGSSRSRKLWPGQDRRPLQRCYLEGTYALSRVARGTTASPAVTTPGKTESRA